MTALLRPLKIGSILVEGNLAAAPMAGYTDKVTRALAIENGAYLTYTEMISAEALFRKSSRTHAMMERAEGEKLLAVQLFGASPESLAAAAEIAAGDGADILDLNVGCPVPKVTKTGAGSALMRNLVLLGKCLKALKRSGLPVTAKIRLGWDDTEINWREAAHVAVEEGVSALGFHPRTRSQGYGGRSDRNALTEAVSTLDIPVIGSGDLHSPPRCPEYAQRDRLCRHYVRTRSRWKSSNIQ
jgi:tRNA-dihydrouridine synthase B